MRAIERNHHLGIKLGIVLNRTINSGKKKKKKVPFCSKTCFMRLCPSLERGLFPWERGRGCLLSHVPRDYPGDCLSVLVGWLSECQSVFFSQPRNIERRACWCSNLQVNNNILSSQALLRLSALCSSFPKVTSFSLFPPSFLILYCSTRARWLPRSKIPLLNLIKSVWYNKKASNKIKK